MSKVCSHIVLKCSYLARIGGPDTLWSVNKLARSVTKWTGACDRRSARLISFIHHTSDYRQYCHVRNAAQHGRSGQFQNSDFDCDLEDSKSTSRGISCIFGSRVEHSSSLVGCARNRRQYPTVLQNQKSFRWMLDCESDGLPALDSWDGVTEVLRSSKSTESPTHGAAGNCSRNHKIQTQTKGKPRCGAIVACGLRHHKSKFFSRRVSVAHL